MNDSAKESALLEALVDLIEVPTSYYQRAIDRYNSLAEWFHSEGSAIRLFDPAVAPQGSFRLGTVIRPLLPSEEYDLDLVCVVVLLKSAVSQLQLKSLIGEEVKSYARANNIKAPVTEGNRCWRLDYADDLTFHMDILPSIPEDHERRRHLVNIGVSEELAASAIAITDKRHPYFDRITQDWLGSNPSGYARWFEFKMREVAQMQLSAAAGGLKRASVDELPTFQWKTPLQRTIQLFKRHRDVMFRADPEGKPISMIIATLAARAYDGERDLASSVARISDKMVALVNDTCPRVPNPTNPAEDFADKWRFDPRLEQNFLDWNEQLKSDLRRLHSGGSISELQRLLEQRFELEVGLDRLRAVAGDRWSEEAEPRRAPTVVVREAPRPWRRG